MSYTAWFRVELPAPEDRRAALEIARRFAARWGARTCRAVELDPEAAALVAPLIDAHGIALEASCYEPLPWSLPEPLLHDALPRVSVTVRSAADGLWTTLALVRDPARRRARGGLHVGTV